VEKQVSKWFFFFLFFLSVMAVVPTTAEIKGGAIQINEESPDQQNAPPEELIQAIQKRKAELDERAGELEKEKQRLQTLKNEINGQLAKLNEAENQKKKKPEGEAEIQMTHLAKMYEAMPAKDAAERMDQMEEPLILKILLRIKPKTGAKILEEMKPSRAAKLSEKLLKVIP
jgi:flagellar motility protein MotE (MotC chaperone)